MKLDKPVLTNNVDLEARRRRRSSSPSRSSAAPQIVKTKFTAGGPHIVLFRPKSFVAEEAGGGAAAVAALAVPDTVPPARPRSSTATSRSATGPKLDEAAIVVSGGRGLGEAEKYEMIEDLAKLLKARARAPPGPSSTPAGCPTATRSARPARS